MADAILNTRLSRHTMLGAGAATAAFTVPSLASLPATAANSDNDLQIAVLAGHHRRATDAVIDLINETERRYGPFAYEEPEHSRPYHACLALRTRCTEALAQAHPTSIQGTVLKLRAAFYCDSLYEADLDCNDENILLTALQDLERLAADITA